jgi:Mg-chelatase subunit ChlD
LIAQVFTPRFLRFFLCLALALISAPREHLLAQERALKTDIKEKVDAILLLDGSGSMRVTDPGRLRDEGAKLFLEFLKPGDRVGIIEFSGDAKVVRPLEPFAREQVSAVAREVDAVGNSGEYTDIVAGLRLAKSVLEANPRSDANQVVVLLSDGKLDPNPAAGSAVSARQGLVEELLPALRESGLKVHTLAFGDLVDRELLEKIAADTSGSSWYTPSASKIHESYAELFLVVKSPQVLPLTTKGFKIDAGIDEATFYINREAADAPISIRSPDGTIITPENPPPSVRWFQGQKFDVVTVLQPRLGDWRINGLPSNDSFATVLTNLKLITDWPTSSSLGAPLLVQARLYENEKPVVLREMAGATKYAFEITPSDKISEPIIREFLFDDGTHGDKVADDGIFSHEVEIAEVGEYRLKVIARAPTFERSQQVPFKIKPRIVELVVQPADEHGGDAAAGAHGSQGDGHGGEESLGGSGDVFSITLSPDAEVLRRIDVKLVAVNAQKKRFVIPLEKHGEGFRGFSSFLPGAGEYQLKATLTGEGRRAGKLKDGGGTPLTIREESAVVTYHKVARPGEESALQVVVVNKEKVESPTPYYVLIVGLNLVLGGVFFALLGRGSAASREPLPEFASIQPLKALLQLLEERAQLIEVDPNDPLFVGDEALPEFAIGGSALLATVDTTPGSASGESTTGVVAASSGEASGEPGGGSAESQGEAPKPAEGA